MKWVTPGLILIILGALAWPIGLWIFHLPVPLVLPVHLSLILPGAYLKRRKKTS